LGLEEPNDAEDQALAEVHRVLKPGGRLYCSEPVYWGSFNEIMRLIDDERIVREAAFAAALIIIPASRPVIAAARRGRGPLLR
jgi:SAM-dependent methyltransferase